MTRRKAKDKYFAHGSTEDDRIKQKSTQEVELPTLQKKPTQQIKLPTIQQGTGRTNGVPLSRKSDTIPQTLAEENHWDNKLHVSATNGATHNDRQLSYCDKSVGWELERQANMKLVAKRMMRKCRDVNDYRPAEMSSTFVYDADSARRSQMENEWARNFDGYDSFYPRETALISSTERERDLDEQRQAMLEVKDKQIKFFRKSKLENSEPHYLSGQAKPCSEKQRHEPIQSEFQEPQERSKRKNTKKTKRGKHVKQNADAIQIENKFKQAEISKCLSVFCDSSVLPCLHEESDLPLSHKSQSNPWSIPLDAQCSLYKQPARDEFEPESFIQSNHTQNNRVRDHVPLPPLRETPNAVAHLPPICKTTPAVPLLPPVLENQQYTNSPLPSIRQGHKDKSISVSSKVAAPQQLMPLPPVKENQQERGLYKAISSPLSRAALGTEDSSDCDSIIQLDTENAPGLRAHVVTDEELRKELRLDLSFTRTPVPRKQSKQSGKHSKQSAEYCEKESARQITKEREDRS